MADKLIYIPIDDDTKLPLCSIQLEVETFGNSAKWSNQSKFKNSPQN